MVQWTVSFSSRINIFLLIFFHRAIVQPKLGGRPKKTRNKIRRQQKNLQEIKHTPLNINKTKREKKGRKNKERKKRESFLCQTEQTQTGREGEPSCWYRSNSRIRSIDQRRRRKRVSWRIDARLWLSIWDFLLRWITRVSWCVKNGPCGIIKSSRDCQTSHFRSQWSHTHTLA